MRPWLLRPAVLRTAFVRLLSGFVSVMSSNVGAMRNRMPSERALKVFSAMVRLPLDGFDALARLHRDDRALPGRFRLLLPRAAEGAEAALHVGRAHGDDVH